MGLISSRSLAASLLLSALAFAAERPQYSGRVRIELSESVHSLAPSDLSAQATAEAAAAAQLSHSIYETLTVLDASGEQRPALAQDWQHDASYKKWQFQLRPDVRFHDGHPLTAVAVVESLRSAGIENMARVAATGDLLFFESDSPLPDLPA